MFTRESPRAAWKVVFLRIIPALALLLFTAGFVIQPVGRAVMKVGLVLLPEYGIPNPFNAMAIQGLDKAEQRLRVQGTVYPTYTWEEVEIMLRQCAMDGNKLCFSVGFFTDESTKIVALEYPSVAFAVLDSGTLVDGLYPPNMRSVIFDHKQAGYLAGVLAGLMTQTDVIGAVDGMDIPPVTAFSDGYRNGAQCNNPDVNVLVDFVGCFDCPELGAVMAADMIANSADVIFNVAGGTGDGAILYAAQAGVWVIGVDSDEYISVFQSGSVAGADRILSSAMKNLDVGLYYTIVDYLTGRFTSGPKLYDLTTGGVGLAPYHEAAAYIPRSVQNTIQMVQRSIILGKIDVNNSCR